MTNNKNKIKVTFAPGVLEQLETEMSTTDLQTFLDGLAEMSADGSLTDFYEQGEPVDMQKLKIEDPELYETLITQMNGVLDETDNPPIH